jgi:predicted CopG family antitoxin
MPLEKMVKISARVHKMLRKIGTKDETFSDVIERAVQEEKRVYQATYCSRC